ncbi:hypothetical protein TeGR_g10055, partial [Tetraparma gracilis]
MPSRPLSTLGVTSFACPSPPPALDGLLKKHPADFQVTERAPPPGTSAAITPGAAAGDVKLPQSRLSLAAFGKPAGLREPTRLAPAYPAVDNSALYGARKAFELEAGEAAALAAMDAEGWGNLGGYLGRKERGKPKAFVKRTFESAGGESAGGESAGSTAPPPEPASSAPASSAPAPPPLPAAPAPASGSLTFPPSRCPLKEDRSALMELVKSRYHFLLVHTMVQKSSEAATATAVTLTFSPFPATLKGFDMSNMSTAAGFTVHHFYHMLADLSNLLPAALPKPLFLSLLPLLSPK